MHKIESREIKNKEIELLLLFINFCKKNNLYYTICGGTLLGAIRHKGFIPWDDDIDVLVPRPDYDKILHNLNTLDVSMLPKNIEFSMWTNNSSVYPFIKMVNKNITIQNPYVTTKADYLWIDIFPIDGNPSDKKELETLYSKVRKLRTVLTVKSSKVGTGKSFVKKLLKPIARLLLAPISSYKLCKLIDDKSKSFNFDEQDSIGGVLWGYGPQERIDKKKYLTPYDVEFEGYTVNAPSNYDEYLSGLYGEYMKLPPEEKRVNHEIIAYEQEDDQI